MLRRYPPLVVPVLTQQQPPQHFVEVLRLRLLLVSDASGEEQPPLSDQSCAWQSLLLLQFYGCQTSNGVLQVLASGIPCFDSRAATAALCGGWLRLRLLADASAEGQPQLLCDCHGPESKRCQHVLQGCSQGRLVYGQIHGLCM